MSMIYIINVMDGLMGWIDYIDVWIYRCIDNMHGMDIWMGWIYAWDGYMDGLIISMYGFTDV